MFISNAFRDQDHFKDKTQISRVNIIYIYIYADILTELFNKYIKATHAKFVMKNK